MLNKTRTSKIDIDIIAKREKSKNNARKAGLLGLFLGPYGVCFFMFFAFLCFYAAGEAKTFYHSIYSSPGWAKRPVCSFLIPVNL